MKPNPIFWMTFFAFLCVLAPPLMLSAEIEELSVGEYFVGTVDYELFSGLKKQADFRARVCGNNGITLTREGGIGTDYHVLLSTVQSRIETIEQKKLAIVTLEKNYGGSDDPNERHSNLVKLLLDKGFEWVVVTLAHSQGSIVTEIHQGSEQGAAPNP